ncbi:MAG: hypothetical protein LBI43_01620 [Streptococcaceae bacterium]|jgi:hypothetical protein|nr:hypothetical protein [Streptococcaceae bacterium]
MKLNKKIISYLAGSAALLSVGAIGLSELLPKQVTADTSEISKNATINYTIGVVLRDFSSLQDYENFMTELGHPYTDDTVIISTDDGWAGFPPGDTSSDVVKNAAGQVIETYTRSDPRGATYAQILAALKARDIAFSKGELQPTPENNRTIAACLAQFKTREAFNRFVTENHLSASSPVLKASVNGANLDGYVLGQEDQTLYDTLGRNEGTYNAAKDANAATVSQIQAAFAS